ncbi:MAG: SHIRT domain-containing protein [Defluviitaleaceae bacterium]|nr:SHIRT domain-containing protein [Defluviitaleaceae bacterium]
MNRKVKTGMKKRIALVLVFILLASTVNQLAFGAVDEHSRVGYINESSGASSPAAIGIMPLDGDTFTATIEGFGNMTDFTLPGQTFSAYLVESRIEAQALTLTIPINDASTNRTITIELANGLGLFSAPGMVGSRNSPHSQPVRPDDWSFNINTLESQFEDIIIGATWTPNDPIVQSISGNTYQPLGGTLVYTVDPNATGVVLTLPLNVISDWAFLLKAHDIASNSRFHPNAISVTLEEDGDVSYSATLARYYLEGRVSYTMQSIYNNVQLPHVQGDEWYTYYNFWAVGTSDTGGSISAGTRMGQLLHETMEFVFHIPKALSAWDDLGVRLAPDETILTEDMFEYEVDAITNATYNILTLRFIQADFSLMHSGRRIAIFGIVPDDTEPGLYTINRPGVGSNFFSVAEGVNPTSTRHNSQQHIRILLPHVNRLNIRNAPGLTISGRFPAAPLSPLGGFRMNNEFNDVLTNQAVWMSFPSEDIGVRGFVLPAGHEGIQNIRAVTSAGNVINLPGPIAITQPASADTSLFPLVNIDLYGMGELASDEFIIEFYYELAGEVPVGAGYAANASLVGNPIASLNFMYLGTFRNPNGVPDDTFITSHAVAGQIDPSNPQGIDEDLRTHTTIHVRAVDTQYFLFISTPGSGSTALAGASLVTNEPGRDVRITFNRHNHSSSNRVQAWSAQGFYIYLRAPIGQLTIDRNSIRATHAGQTFRESNNTLVIDELIDSTGSLVYRLSLPTATLGWYNNHVTQFPSIGVYFNIAALPTAHSATHHVNEIMFISTMDADINVHYATNLGRVLCADTFFFGDHRTMAGMTVGTTHLNHNPILVTASATLSTHGEIRTLDTNNMPSTAWQSYNWQTGSSVINLAPEEAIQHRLLFVNNSGVSVNDFVSLLPIPKSGGVLTGMNPTSNLQREAFGFSLNLTDPVSVPAGFAVHYATVHTMDEDYVGFVPWASISDPSEIRMVRITSTLPIPDGEEGEFLLNLAPLSVEDVAAAEYNGNFNRYAVQSNINMAGSTIDRHNPVAMRMWQNVTFHHGTRSDATNIPSGIFGAAIGSTFTIPTNVPESPGYTFQGWSRNNVYDPGDTFTMPANNVVFTAIWERYAPDEFDITYTFTGDVPPNVTTPAARPDIEEGTTGLSATAVNPASVPGEFNGVEGTFTFGGWTTQDVTLAGNGTFTMPGNDVEFTGHWTFTPTTQSETTPSETTPSETTPSETTPSETTPSETTPSETTPSETTASETTSSETTAAETTASETTASNTTAATATTTPTTGTITGTTPPGTTTTSTTGTTPSTTVPSTTVATGTTPNTTVPSTTAATGTTPGQVPHIPTVPPPTVNQNHELIPNENGYIEVDQNGTPLGQWTWDDTTASWVFHETNPIAVGFMPQTGVDNNRAIFNILMYSTTLIVGVAVLWFVIHAVYKRKQEKASRHGEADDLM